MLDIRGSPRQLSYRCSLHGVVFVPCLEFTQRSLAWSIQASEAAHRPNVVLSCGQSSDGYPDG
jgi:hypothetical protein